MPRTRDIAEVLLRVHHRTTYLYSQPVTLGPHRLMLRPRETVYNRLLSFSVETTPPSLVHWSEDVHGNMVAVATPLWPSDILVIDSHLRLDHHQIEGEPTLHVAPAASQYPFTYSAADQHGLGDLAHPHYADPEAALPTWIQAYVAALPTPTVAMLCDINTGIAGWFFYQSRETLGTQTPLETLQRGWGCCRDIALLFVEAVRWLGLGARLVSGYLYNPLRDGLDDVAFATGATHCWAEVYLPGAGWVAFDPTHGTMGGFGLVAVATARDIQDLAPVCGSFTGPGHTYIGMTVGVAVSSGNQGAAAIPP